MAAGLFPPPEAQSSKSTEKPFSPKVWAATRPPPASALHAFAARIRLFEPLKPDETPRASPLGIPNLLVQALTHHSYSHVKHQNEPLERLPRTNCEWEAVGNHLMGLFAAEYVHATWPHLPTRLVTAAVTAFVGHQTCADVAREWGVANLIRWAELPSMGGKKAVTREDAYASAPRSIVALTYFYMSISHARALVHKWFLSREVDLRPLIKFKNPQRALRETARMFERELPQARLLKETGRHSISPIYVVGMYSGQDKLGEGFGSSLDMAEFRAAEDALRRLYLTHTPSHQLSLPTSTFPSEPALDSFEQLDETTVHVYKPQELGYCEVTYGAADRTTIPSQQTMVPVESGGDGAGKPGSSDVKPAR